MTSPAAADPAGDPSMHHGPPLALPGADPPALPAPAQPRRAGGARDVEIPCATPVCGDDITLQLKVTRRDASRRLSFHGPGLLHLPGLRLHDGDSCWRAARSRRRDAAGGALPRDDARRRRGRAATGALGDLRRARGGLGSRRASSARSWLERPPGGGEAGARGRVRAENAERARGCKPPGSLRGTPSRELRPQLSVQSTRSSAVRGSVIRYVTSICHLAGRAGDLEGSRRLLAPRRDDVVPPELRGLGPHVLLDHRPSVADDHPLPVGGAVAEGLHQELHLAGAVGVQRMCRTEAERDRYGVGGAQVAPGEPQERQGGEGDDAASEAKGHEILQGKGVSRCTPESRPPRPRAQAGGGGGRPAEPARGPGGEGPPTDDRPPTALTDDRRPTTWGAGRRAGGVAKRWANFCEERGLRSSRGRRDMKRMGRRVAIVEGCRTPFAKSGTEFKELSAVELGKVAVRELISRTEPGRGGDRPPGLRHRRAVGAGAEHRARGAARLGDPALGAGVHRGPRLRLLQPGDHLGGRAHRAGAGRRGDRGRRGVAHRHPDPLLRRDARRAGDRLEGARRWASG